MQQFKLVQRALARRTFASSAVAASASASSASVSAAGASKQSFRRSIFYVPGSDERKILSSAKAGADCRIFDLEDSVTFSKKGAARQLVFSTLETLPKSPQVGERAVRINAVGSGLEVDDLNVVLQSSNLDALLIPKVNCAKDIAFIANMIDSIAPESRRNQIKIMASIESAKGLLNVSEIATADERVDALVFAAEDYCADLGLKRTPSRLEMIYARQAVVTAAVAFGLQAIDLVCVDYKREEVLREECTEGRNFGFTGKQAIHPAQVKIIQEHFSPSAQEFEYATKIVEGYRAHQKVGVGAFNLEGKMIDMPVVKWAENILVKAELMKR